jgi:hypothetical protein
MDSGIVALSDRLRNPLPRGKARILRVSSFLTKPLQIGYFERSVSSARNACSKLSTGTIRKPPA